MMETSGTARANSAISLSCGKDGMMSSDNPLLASTRAPARKVLVGQDTGRLTVVDLRVGTPGHVVADAFETVGASGLESVEDTGDVVAEFQVCGTDNGGCGPGLAVHAAGAGGGQALNEFHLANGPQFLGAGGAVHGAGLQKNRGAHVVARVKIGHQLVQQVPLIGDADHAPVPEVVMRVAEGNLRLDRVFLRKGQPIVISKWHCVTSQVRDAPAQ